MDQILLRVIIALWLFNQARSPFEVTTRSRISLSWFFARISIIRYDSYPNIHLVSKKMMSYNCMLWSISGVEVKVDGLGGKWTVQLGESGRSKAPKVDGPGSKWTVRKDIKWTVHESGRSKRRKWTVHKVWNWTVLKNAWVVKRDESGRSKWLKVDGPKLMMGSELA